MEKQLNEIDGETKTTGWECWTVVGIWLSVYPCLRTSWRHKCQLWAVCGLPTKLLAHSSPDWFCLLDSWHAMCELWPSMCHSNAMASQSPRTSVLIDIRVSTLHLHISAMETLTWTWFLDWNVPSLFLLLITQNFFRIFKTNKYIRKVLLSVNQADESMKLFFLQK